MTPRRTLTAAEFRRLTLGEWPPEPPQPRPVARPELRKAMDESWYEHEAAYRWLAERD